jgi:hypothetical protein
MTRPKAYDPCIGQKYQLFGRWNSNEEYDHLDYARTKQEKDYIISEYHLGSPAYMIKAILLPRKYWTLNTKQKTALEKHWGMRIRVKDGNVEAKKGESWGILCNIGEGIINANILLNKQ